MDLLIKQKETKLKLPYQVTTTSKAVKDVDMTKRIVSGVFNSYYFIDNDLDMLLPGCAAKSINERGVGSKKGNKIKHLKDHNWNDNIAELIVLDERDVSFDGKIITGIYHESYYPEATDSNNQLIKIQSGMYDDRSIGFQYKQLALCEKDSEIKERVENWERYLPMAMNPEKAEEFGFFWVVKEIKMFEGSDVAFGSNELTPLLGVKTDNPEAITAKLFEKLDVITSLFKSGNLTDEGFHQLEMENLQIKSYINSLITKEPSIKDTILNNGRTEIGTQSKSVLKFLM